MIFPEIALRVGGRRRQPVTVIVLAVVVERVAAHRVEQLYRAGTSVCRGASGGANEARRVRDVRPRASGAVDLILQLDSAREVSSRVVAGPDADHEVRVGGPRLIRRVVHSDLRAGTWIAGVVLEKSPSMLIGLRGSHATTPVACDGEWSHTSACSPDPRWWWCQQDPPACTASAS